MNVQWYNRFSKRERILLVLTVTAAILAAWHRLVWMPFSQAMLGVESRLAAQVRVGGATGDGWNVPWKVQAKQWLPAGEVAGLLDRLTQPGHGLRMVGMEMRPSRLLLSCEQGLSKEGATALFRHELILTLEGGYIAVLAYLYGLEELPWKINVDHLDYSVSHPPQATLLLQLHFLSLSHSLFVD